MDGIGFSILEGLTLLTALTGMCWLLARRRRARVAEGARKPLWVSWGAELFGVFALITFCRVGLADWPNVPTGSMEPTLRVGDYLLINKLAYGPRLPFTNTALPLAPPQRGDVVVFRDPQKVSQLLVKRLVGLPGDEVLYLDGVVSVNGAPFQVALDTAQPPRPEDRGQLFVLERAAGHARTVKVDARQPGALVPPQAWLAEAAQCEVQAANAWRCRVPEGRYLMMGDNRDNSADSRIWGFLDAHEVVGKAVRVLVNFHDLQRAWSRL